MLNTFLAIFVADTKMIFRYNFVASLRFQGLGLKNLTMTAINYHLKFHDIVGAFDLSKRVSKVMK